MNKFILFIFVITFTIGYSQETAVELNNRFNYSDGLSSTGSGTWAMSTADKKIKGSPYLFDNWVNLASIITGDGKTYNLKSINYDTKQHRFVTKTTPDSVFVFSAHSIKQVKVNNIIFKRYNVNDNYMYYELVAFGKGQEILKKSYKKIKKGVLDPFTNTYKQDKYVLKSDYFVNSKLGIKELKLKKKFFLKLFGDQSKMIKKFISKNKLSVNKDADIVEIFDYYNKI